MLGLAPSECEKRTAVRCPEWASSVDFDVVERARMREFCRGTKRFSMGPWWALFRSGQAGANGHGHPACPASGQDFPFLSAVSNAQMVDEPCGTSRSELHRNVRGVEKYMQFEVPPRIGIRRSDVRATTFLTQCFALRDAWRAVGPGTREVGSGDTRVGRPDPLSALCFQGFSDSSW